MPKSMQSSSYNFSVSFLSFFAFMSVCLAAAYAQTFSATPSASNTEVYFPTFVPVPSSSGLIPLASVPVYPNPTPWFPNFYQAFQFFVARCSHFTYDSVPISSLGCEIVAEDNRDILSILLGNHSLANDGCLTNDLRDGFNVAAANISTLLADSYYAVVDQSVSPYLCNAGWWLIMFTSVEFPRGFGDAIPGSLLTCFSFARYFFSEHSSACSALPSPDPEPSLVPPGSVRDASISSGEMWLLAGAFMYIVVAFGGLFYLHSRELPLLDAALQNLERIAAHHAAEGRGDIELPPIHAAVELPFTDHAVAQNPSIISLSSRP